MAERHVMIDLETLGRRPGCAIASIGALDFDPAGGDDFIAGEFYRPIDWQSSGLALEPETVAWWLGQPTEARIELADPAGGAWELPAALWSLASYLGEGADDDLVLWCQGASFDFAILGAAYDHCTITRPWNYWQERCARTIRKVAGVPEPERAEADKHHALRDAAHQVRCVQAALRALRGGRCAVPGLESQERQRLGNARPGAGPARASVVRGHGAGLSQRAEGPAVEVGRMGCLDYRAASGGRS